MKTSEKAELARQIQGRAEQLPQAPPSTAFGPDATMRAVARECGETLATKVELDQLRPLQAKYDEYVRAINKCGQTDAKVAWLEHCEALAKHATPASPHDGDAYSRADFESDFHERAQMFNQERIKVSAAALEICRIVAARFVDACTKFADTREQADRFDCIQFGVVYPGPSAVVGALRKCAVAAAGRVAHNSYSSPKTMAPYIADLL